MTCFEHYNCAIDSNHGSILIITVGSSAVVRAGGGPVLSKPKLCWRKRLREQGCWRSGGCFRHRQLAGAPGPCAGSSSGMAAAPSIPCSWSGPGVWTAGLRCSRAGQSATRCFECLRGWNLDQLQAKSDTVQQIPSNSNTFKQIATTSQNLLGSTTDERYVI